MWIINYTDAAKKDLKKLDGSVRPIVVKAVRKVAKNPLAYNEGGYGKPLGNKAGRDLTGLLKIKLVRIGIRVVYKLEKNEKTGVMKIIVVSARSDSEVYDIAEIRERRG